MASQYSNKVLDVISDYPKVSLLKGRFRGIVYIVSSQYSNKVLDVISDYPKVSLLKGRFRGIVYI